VDALFAGIAQLDANLNLLPHAARSWEVLDDGTRYLIHLRDDVGWTDGSAVTAADYEWAWKRNLDPDTRAPYAHWFDPVVGARAFRQGQSADPETVGVRALDAFTLEVRLESRAAYFPYIFAMPLSFPLPRAVIGQAGSQWWEPAHIISNGAFRLLQFDQVRGTLERNPDYFGEFSGNLDTIEWRIVPDDADRARDYLAGESDCIECDLTRVPSDVGQQLSPLERHSFRVLSVAYLAFVPRKQPLDDLRVRQALIQSLDKERIPYWYSSSTRSARGGMIPPGIPGHSPEMGLSFDVTTARRLLAEAGFAEGRGFPRLKLSYPYALGEATAREMAHQWQEHLGITIQFGHIEAGTLWTSEQVLEIFFGPWVLDYPDPDGSLRTCPLYDTLQRGAWGNTRFGELVAEAGRTGDRARRMAMYREADRIWVAEEAVVSPLAYNSDYFLYTKPWVKGVTISPLGHFLFKEIKLEPH
jgi:ABC-type oligopeptide transport system substrate-binding subunit